MITETQVLLAGPLPEPLGAQEAEITALTEAAKYAIGTRANIYTDSNMLLISAMQLGLYGRNGVS